MRGEWKLVFRLSMVTVKERLGIRNRILNVDLKIHLTYIKNKQINILNINILNIEKQYLH